MGRKRETENGRNEEWGTWAVMTFPVCHSERSEESDPGIRFLPRGRGVEMTLALDSWAHSSGAPARPDRTNEPGCELLHSMAPLVKKMYHGSTRIDTDYHR